MEDQVASAFMNKAQDAFAEWRKAAANAHALEVQITGQWERVMAHTDAAPSAEMLLEVHRLREVANEKLSTLRVLLGGAPKAE